MKKMFKLQLCEEEKIVADFSDRQQHLDLVRAYKNVDSRISSTADNVTEDKYILFKSLNYLVLQNRERKKTQTNQLLIWE